MFLAAVVALTLTPGPDMIYVASRALGQGRAAGVLSAFGVITGTFVHLGLAARGSGAFCRQRRCASLALSSAAAQRAPDWRQKSTQGLLR